MNLPRRTTPRAKAVSTAAAKPTVRYRVEVLSPQAHLFAITLEIDHPAPRQRLSLPVWIPGSYLVREFSQHLQHLQATQGGEPVPLRQLDKNSWQVTADTGQALVLRYEVYAFDASVRTAFLDSSRGFFNATSLCLMVAGREDEPHAIEIQPGDELVAYTDGYADQFGGEKGKKLKLANLHAYLLRISNEKMTGQHTLLKAHFHSWKGNLDQVDDVCVFGVKLI